MTNELRIGNLIKAEGQVTRVRKLEPPYIGTDYLIAREEAFEPIIVTEDVLVKVGFELYRTPHYLEYKMKVITGWDEIMEEEEYTTCRVIKGKGDSRGWHFYFDGVHVIPCGYLHQLQNGFFALYGKELNYEL